MKKLSYEYVKNQIENTGYKLLSNEYKGALSKLKVECPEGHQYEVTYDNFRVGKRCPICAGLKKLTYVFIKTKIEKKGYKLLSKEYKNVATKLKVECSKGHTYTVNYNNFQRGKRCPICYDKIRGDQTRLDYNDIKAFIEKEEYKLLSKEYITGSKKLLVECPFGHQYKVAYHNFQKGKRCPICWDLTNHSRSEKDCLNIVKQLTNENVIENDRTQIINPKTGWNLELDIWIPSLQKAIEFNGKYWHDNEYSKYKDNQKVKQCREKNIDFIVIKYKNWIENRKKQIEKIKLFLGEVNVKT